MSADNFLALVPNGKKIDVRDLGFSYYSSLQEWNDDDRPALAKLARQGHGLVGSYDTAEDALKAADEYARTNIVEYGIVSFIPNVDIQRQIVGASAPETSDEQVSDERPHCVVQQEKHPDRIVEDVLGPFPSEEAAKTFVADFIKRRPDQDHLYHHRIFEMLDPAKH